MIREICAEVPPASLRSTHMVGRVHTGALRIVSLNFIVKQVRQRGTRGYGH